MDERSGRSCRDYGAERCRSGRLGLSRDEDISQRWSGARQKTGSLPDVTVVISSKVGDLPLALAPDEHVPNLTRKQRRGLHDDPPHRPERSLQRRRRRRALRAVLPRRRRRLPRVTHPEPERTEPAAGPPSLVPLDPPLSDMNMTMVFFSTPSSFNALNTLPTAASSSSTWAVR